MKNIFSFLQFYFNQRPMLVSFIVICAIFNILLIIQTHASDLIIILNTIIGLVFFTMSVLFCYKFEYITQK